MEITFANLLRCYNDTFLTTLFSMEFIRGLYNLKDRHHGCVVTIGNFDGVHQGHQKIIDRLKAKAAELNLPTCIINFEPYPQEFFSGEQAPARLSRTVDKIKVYQAKEIDRLLVLKFNSALQNLSGEEFIQQILIDGLGTRHLIVGDDFQFGKNRSGNYQLLKEMGEKHGYSVEPLLTVSDQGERISSTRIRHCLEQGDLEEAARLLGHPFSICAKVTHGQKLGRTIGFPTANLPTHRKKTPVLGVYAVTTVVDGQTVNGVANIGKRPTVNGVAILLEVHLFDFKGDLYGKRLTVQLLHRIRDEKKFDSFDLLKKQIEKDVQTAREYFSG